MCMCVYIYNIYVHFSKLGCLLYILCITSCFPSQNTTLHSAHHEPLLTATNGTETTHYGLGWQMAIKTMDANHIPKVWRQSCPAPGKAELVHSCHSSLGTSAQGTVVSTRGGTRSPPATISSTALIPISVSQDQEHRVTPIPCPQSSRSLLLPIEKTILSFIFDPKLFSCG